MTEPDVALTDYALAIEGALFAWWLARNGARSPLRGWAILFFLALVAASLAGGTVHGFFLDADSTGYRTLWPLTLVAIGVTAAAAWMIGAYLSVSDRAARGMAMPVMAGLAIYGLVIAFVSQAFVVAIAFYLPAALFLLIVFGSRYRRLRDRPSRTGAAGMVLTFVASGVQQSGWALHPVYFNHNALYHAIQAVALAMIYRALSGLMPGAGSRRPGTRAAPLIDRSFLDRALATLGRESSRAR